jgi:hypothetical protein
VAFVFASGIGIGLVRAARPMQTGQPAAARAPIFELDPAWPKLPEKYAFAEVSSVAIDEQDHAWILHRPRSFPDDKKALATPPVLEFDPAGNLLQAWGGAGAGYEWPEREHGIFVDHKGLIWIGGNNCSTRNLPLLKPVGDDQLLKFTKAGKFVLQIGRSDQGRGNGDTKNLRQPADTFVYRKTNEAFVADGYGNHRVIVLDADTGAFKRMWGAFGNKPVDQETCPPPTGPPLKDDHGDGPDQFAIVHAARVSNDGHVYVADRENRRIQVFTIDGKFVTQVVLGPKTAGLKSQISPGCVAFSADPQQQFLYASGGSQIVVLDRKTLRVVSSFGGANAHHLTTDSKGNIYTAETGQRRAQRFLFKGLQPQG